MEEEEEEVFLLKMFNTHISNRSEVPTNADVLSDYDKFELSKIY